MSISRVTSRSRSRSNRRERCGDGHVWACGRPVEVAPASTMGTGTGTGAGAASTSGAGAAGALGRAEVRGAMIVGIGVDTVDIARFERQLERTPALRPRLFTEAERELPLASLAARFAAREALIKALGDSHGLGWHDMAVVNNQDRAPSFLQTDALVRVMKLRGADRLHLSMTHDGGMATAFVVAEGEAAA